MIPVNRSGRRSLRRSLGLMLALCTALCTVVVGVGTAPAQASTHRSGDVLINDSATWTYWRGVDRPLPGWAEIDYDDRAWSTGQAPFGYGSRLTEGTYRTRLEDLPQVRTTYFRHVFELAAAERPLLHFRTWADDAVVVYVNGTEVGRSGIADRIRPIPHAAVWATGAPRTSSAVARGFTVEIDPELLQSGHNVISAVVIPNWRASFDVTFGGELVVAGPGVAPDPVGGPADEEPAPVKPSVLPRGDLVAAGQNWEYRRQVRGPSPEWKFQQTTLGWPSGTAPFGAGRAADHAATALPSAPAPLSTYFRRTFRLTAGQEALQVGATVTTWADDGVIVFVNGHEVGRHRVRMDVAGAHAETWASEAPSWRRAQAELISFGVPSAYLREGLNVVAVQVVSNFTRTEDVSFDASLKTGVDGPVLERKRPLEDWQLVWSDEFSGSALDESSWTAYHNSTYGDGNLETACLMNRPENLSVQDGHLYLTARREPAPIRCGRNDERFPDGRVFTSAQIMSRDKVSFMYGRVEIRAQLPVAQGSSQGLWPAFWLRTTEGLGEIDILEALGSGPSGDWQAGVVYHSVHRETVNPTASVRSSYEIPMGLDMSDGFHTFALEWEPDELRFFVDDVMTARYTAADVPWITDSFNDREYFIRLNLAVGGTWPGYVDSSTRLPASYVIDYVRIYQAR